MTDTRDSKLSSALSMIGHNLSNTDPCEWYQEASGSYGVFFHEAQPGLPLSVEEVAKIWRDNEAFDSLTESILSYVPEADKETVNKMIHGLAVASARSVFGWYKSVTMPALNRSKEEQGFTLERRGNKTLKVGKNVSETDIAELKKEGGF